MYLKNKGKYQSLLKRREGRLKENKRVTTFSSHTSYHESQAELPQHLNSREQGKGVQLSSRGQELHQNKHGQAC